MNPLLETVNTMITEIVHLLETQARLVRMSGESAAWQRTSNDEQLDLLFYDLEHRASEGELLPALHGVISALQEQRRRLPCGPQFMIIKEAQTLLNYPNLVLLATQEFGPFCEPSIASLCERLGHPLSRELLATATDRATHQLRPLEAMAQGISASYTKSSELVRKPWRN